METGKAIGAPGNHMWESQNATGVSQAIVLLKFLPFIFLPAFLPFYCFFMASHGIYESTVNYQFFGKKKELCTAFHLYSFYFCEC